MYKTPKTNQHKTLFEILEETGQKYLSKNPKIEWILDKEIIIGFYMFIGYTDEHYTEELWMNLNTKNVFKK